MADDDLTTRPTSENDPTLAAHAQAAAYGINLSSTKAAYIAEAVLAASGLRESLAARDAMVAEALAIHVPMAYWSGEDHTAMVDENGEDREPEGHVCLTCSGPSVEDDISNWELDLSDSAVVLWPCETVQALSRVPQGAAEPNDADRIRAGSGMEPEYGEGNRG